MEKEVIKEVPKEEKVVIEERLLRGRFLIRRRLWRRKWESSEGGGYNQAK